MSDLVYDEEVKPGSSVVMGIIKTPVATLKFQKGYFGGGLPITREALTNPANQKAIVSIEFRDGCSTGQTIAEDLSRPEWKDEVKAFLTKFKIALPVLERHIQAREAVFEIMKPLEEKASLHANAMFDLVEGLGEE